MERRDFPVGLCQTVGPDFASRPSLPRLLTVGVLGEFSGGNQRHSFLQYRAFKQVDFDNFNDVMSELGPRIRFSVPTSVVGELDLDLVFHALEDFEPENLINRIDALRQLRQSTDGEAHAALALYMDRILHAPEFKAVESAWRGLWYLVSTSETSAQLQIKLLDVSKGELLRDLQESVDFDQSALFKAIYEKPYGDIGEVPFGLLIGNFTFGISDTDVNLLERLAAVASHAHAPFVAAAGPEMFGFDDFKTFTQATRYSPLILDLTDCAKWKRFRESEHARYVALTLPRILLRSPYGVRPGIPEDFKYEEDTRSESYLLWGNAAFAFGACVANAFARYGWCSAIRGVEGGGLVDGLPTWIADNEESRSRRSSIEFVITDRLEKELSDAGLLPLVQGNSDFAVFFSATSCAKPRRFDNDAANTNSRLSCQLEYILTASRFMHYLKVMVRDRIGSYVTRSDLERWLNVWISKYVCGDDQASPAIQAQLPLREAKVEVSEETGNPGSYRVVMFVRPHFQLEELTVSLRLVGSIGSLRG